MRKAERIKCKQQVHQQEQFVNEKGETKTEFNVGEKFRILIPKHQLVVLALK